MTEDLRVCTYAYMYPEIIQARAAFRGSDFGRRMATTGYKRYRSAYGNEFFALRCLWTHVFECAAEEGAILDVAFDLYWHDKANTNWIYGTLLEFRVAEPVGLEDEEAAILALIGPYHTGHSCRECGQEIVYQNRAEDYRCWEVSLCPSCFDDRDDQGHSGYVYILQSGDAFKIGKAIDVDRRIMQISPIPPYPVKLIHSIRTTNHHALETQLHEYFAAKRLNGEWFKLTDQDVRLLKCMQDVEI